MVGPFRCPGRRCHSSTGHNHHIAVIDQLLREEAEEEEHGHKGSGRWGRERTGKVGRRMENMEREGLREGGDEQGKAKGQKGDGRGRGDSESERDFCTSQSCLTKQEMP